MRIRIFRATTLAEAMGQVRAELGLDALILATTTQGDNVEVTAALEPEDEPDLPDPARLDLLKGLRHEHELTAAAPAHAVPPADCLGRHNLPAELCSALRQGPLEASCSRLFRFARLPMDADGAPLMLAGSPGSGKTLTIAKLATRLVMEGHRPLVITADEQRAGAVEQLAAFTRLLGLTLIAAGRPEMLERALRRREPLSPVLIDAPGLDLLDPVQEELLASLIAASGARTTLVLAAGVDPMEATEAAAAHAQHGVQLLIATRLDRVGRLGGILAASRSADLALTEAGIGTDVADGLSRLTPATLAARLAGAAPPGLMRKASTLQPAPAPASVLDQAALARHIAAQSGARSTHRPEPDRPRLRSINP